MTACLNHVTYVMYPQLNTYHCPTRHCPTRHCPTRHCPIRHCPTRHCPTRHVPQDIVPSDTTRNKRLSSQTKSGVCYVILHSRWLHWILTIPMSYYHWKGCTHTHTYTIPRIVLSILNLFSFIIAHLTHKRQIDFVSILLFK